MKKFKKSLCLLLAAFTVATMGNVNAFAQSSKNADQAAESSEMTKESIAKGSSYNSSYNTISNLH